MVRVNIIIYLRVSLNITAIPANTFTDQTINSCNDLSFLATVGEVVVTSTQVIVGSPSSHFGKPKIKVSTSIIKLRQFSTILNYKKLEGKKSFSEDNNGQSTGL